MVLCELKAQLRSIFENLAPSKLVNDEQKSICNVINYNVTFIYLNLHLMWYHTLLKKR